MPFLFILCKNKCYMFLGEGSSSMTIHTEKRVRYFHALSSSSWSWAWRQR